MIAEVNASPGSTRSRARGESLEISIDETRGMQRSPRPLDDGELEGVSGGIDITVSFQDGCSIRVTGARNVHQATVAAEEVHDNMH